MSTMNTMLDASIHGSAFLVQDARSVAAPTIARLHGNEAMEVT
jgi:hypothetical protein